MGSHFGQEVEPVNYSLDKNSKKYTQHLLDSEGDFSMKVTRTFNDKSSLFEDMMKAYMKESADLFVKSITVPNKKQENMER